MKSCANCRYGPLVASNDLEKRTRKLVVAGLVVDGEQVLVTQRCAHQPLPLKWEFPGGKIEAGESPEVALKRELLEEIGVEVEVAGVWEVLFHPYPDFDMLMLIYPCRIVGEASVQCLEVADFAWVLPAGLKDFEILIADRPLVQRLQKEGLTRLAWS